MNFYKIFFLNVLLFSSFTTYGASVDVKLDIKFASGKSFVDDYGVRTLEKLQVVLTQHPQSNLLISGHTDSLGSDEYNEGLSVDRALAVKNKLVSLGIDSDSISAKGFGETAPIAENTTKLGRSENRRVVASILGLSNVEAKAVPFFIDSIEATDRLVVLETESDVVAEYKEDLEQPVSIDPAPVAEPKMKEQEVSLPLVVEENEVKKVTSKKRVQKRKKRRGYIAGYIGPHWDSNFYGDDVVYEHGRFNFLTLGVDAGFKLSRNWFLDGYFYYLPTRVNQGSSSIVFSKGSSVKYENNIYGLRAGYTFKRSKKYRLSVIAGLKSHVLGGVERRSVTDYSIEKIRHNGLGIGLRWERKLTSKWVFDSDLSYIIPLSISNIEQADGKLWYRGILGFKRRLSKRRVLSFEYQALYHESDFVFASGFETSPEFFIQTLMVGLKYNF